MESWVNKLIVVIPAYEPMREFVDYAKTVAAFAKRLVVVNDGSGREYDGIFKKIASIENVDYISYGENRGKGYALKAAFKFCTESFSENDIIVTADCDGQHTAEDVLALYRAAIENTGALVLGARDFREEHVPKRNRFGNTFSRGLYKLLYGIKLYDTQTGLRGFNVALARKFLHLRGNRFEYELGQLIFSHKSGVKTVQIPIKTVYPGKQEEHTSHFRPIRDSMRVIGAMLSNLGFYFASSALSAAVDVGAFYLLSAVLLGDRTWYVTLVSTVVARLLSSVVNFTLNFKYVFASKDKRAVLRYYALWCVQLSFSFGIAAVFSELFGLWGIYLTVAKGFADLCLALLSYQVQRVWVFADASHRFWSPGIRALKAVATLFSKEYRCNCTESDTGVVYVARHLDMHGPYTTLKWMPFDFHPMILSVFFDRECAYKQYSEYTFTKRAGKPVGSFNIKAWISSLVVPVFVKGVKGIPVYRDKRAARTFVAMLQALERGEPIMVYADVDYTAGADRESPIYEGFLYAGEYYKRKTGESLRFIPVFIDDERRLITQSKPIVVDNFYGQKDAAAAYLRAAINGKDTDAC